MIYHTVFDVTSSGLRNWWFPAFGLIFIFLSGRSALRPQASDKQRPALAIYRGVLGWVMLVFSVLWTVGSSLVVFGSDLAAMRDAREGRYDVVEGRVENFSSGPKQESFDVNGQHFSYSDYEVRPGFNRMATKGGPIHQGLQVRIARDGNNILKLEVGQ